MSHIPLGWKKRILNLVLGGGGIKGIAYSGVFGAAEKRGYRWGNIAGVSAGAVAGACIAAGYKSQELWNAIDKFNFTKIKLDRIAKKVPIVQEIMEIKNKQKLSYESISRAFFVNNNSAGSMPDDYRANLLKEIVKYCQKGCLFDGDYLEEWVSKLLLRKGAKTFGDLRGGIRDPENPEGYKVRMTAVDCNRVKVIVLPDDISYYGIDPDDLEVAKAVRMSTSVPFAFRPVEIKRKQGNKTMTHYIIDGGVLDRFPSWLIEHSSKYPPAIGFTLDGGEKKGNLIMDTPLDILKALISIVHDIGVPTDVAHNMKHVEKIDTSCISFLDFNIGQEEKRYLHESGKKAAIKLFNKLEKSPW